METLTRGIVGNSLTTLPANGTAGTAFALPLVTGRYSLAWQVVPTGGPSAISNSLQISMDGTNWTTISTDTTTAGHYTTVNDVVAKFVRVYHTSHTGGTGMTASILLTVMDKQMYGVWDDLCVIPPAGVNPGGADTPATVITDANGYLGSLQFDAIGESATVNFQLPHRYQRGTDIKPHIHVVRNDGTDNTGNVEFEAKFRVIPLRGSAFAWTAYSDGTLTVQPADGANQSGLIFWTLANSSYNFGISDQIIMLIRRKALTTGSVALTSADVHGYVAQEGSREEGSL